MKKAFTILYTDDMHSSLIGMGPAADYTPFTLNDDTTRGGYALRLLTEMPQANADGSYDLYFGPKAPAARKACGSRPSRAKGGGALSASTARKRRPSTERGSSTTSPR